MPDSVTVARGIGWLLTALACLTVLAACAASGPVPKAATNGPVSLAGTTPPGSPAAKVYVKRAGFLNGVSCVSATDCTAVGDYYKTAAGPTLTLIERWNGTAWRVEPSPALGRTGTLASVSCPSATSCAAVGSLIMGWNGVTWKVERQSSPFVSVSCATPHSCLAVGVTAGGVPESGYWNGTGWKLERMPGPGQPGASITLAGDQPAPAWQWALTTAAALSPSRGTASRGGCSRCRPRRRLSRLSVRWGCPAPGQRRTPRSGPAALPSPSSGQAHPGGSPPRPACLLEPKHRILHRTVLWTLTSISPYDAWARSPQHEDVMAARDITNMLVGPAGVPAADLPAHTVWRSLHYRARTAHQ